MHEKMTNDAVIHLGGYESENQRVGFNQASPWPLYTHAGVRNYIGPTPGEAVSMGRTGKGKLYQGRLEQGSDPEWDHRLLFHAEMPMIKYIHDVLIPRVPR